ncbi:arsenate reductase family protein [Marivirga sericea]|nr:ArsC/Spx/MgsR family protein [Marivirga sericea]
METNKKSDMEIKFIYNSTQIKEREALGYAKSLDQHYINEIDLEKETLTERHWAEIATALKVELKELIDENNDYYQDELKGKDFDEQDLLQLIASHPQIIKTPIIHSTRLTRFIKSPYDFNEMDLAFEEIKKHLANKGESDE